MTAVICSPIARPTAKQTTSTATSKSLPVQVNSATPNTSISVKRKAEGQPSTIPPKRGRPPTKDKEKQKDKMVKPDTSTFVSAFCVQHFISFVWSHSETSKCCSSPNYPALSLLK